MKSTQYKMSHLAISNGSKTFRLAGFFLNTESRYYAFSLYYWCRYCDDIIDENEDQRELQLKSLEFLYDETALALNQRYHEESSPFYSLFDLVEIKKIPKKYFYDLLKGFEIDVRRILIQHFSDLDRYCYHVAGVVGLMMTSVLGVNKVEALEHADALGRAMQLTNIARDVREDYLINRIYIPRDWLDEMKIDYQRLMDDDQSDLVFELVLRILNIAEEKYFVGREGIKYLPFRAGWSISIASFLYQNIGNKMRKIGPGALNSRTYLTLAEKIYSLFQGTYFFFCTKLQGILFFKKMKGMS